MIEKSYLTRLINDTKRPLMVYEHDGTALVELMPGREFTIESRSNRTTFAKWSEVRWTEDGQVHFVTRTNWTEPERGRWTIRLLNQDGKEIERRTIGGESVCLMKHVPVLLGLRLDDPLVKSKSLTIIRKRIPVKDPEKFGYLLFETINKDELEEREPAELKALEKLLAEKS